MQPLIDAALAGMHAQFSGWYVHKSNHEVTITCDMLQFWLRDEPLGDRLYEFTLSFRADEVRRWAKLDAEHRITNFNIEFHPSSLWREMEAALVNADYVAKHRREAVEQLLQDLERMVDLAKQALAAHPAAA